MENNEKVSVNMNIGTLSQIDLLVDQGFYSNRSDFINQAVREYLNQKQERINEEKEKYDKKNYIWFLGIYSLRSQELLQIKENGGTKRITGYGMLYIDERLDPLVRETISEIRVKGKGNYTGSRSDVTFEILDPRTVAEARLSDRIAEIEAAGMNDYAAADRTVLEETIRNARALLANSSASIQELEAALSAINSAKAAADENLRIARESF